MPDRRLGGMVRPEKSSHVDDMRSVVPSVKGIGNLDHIGATRPQRFRHVNDLRSQVYGTAVDETVRGIDLAEVIASTQFDANRRPVVLLGNVHHLNAAADCSGKSPVGVVDLDLPRADHTGDNGDVTEWHSQIGPETQNATGLWNMPTIEAPCRRRPPSPSVPIQGNAGQRAREWHALKQTVPRPGRRRATQRYHRQNGDHTHVPDHHALRMSQSYGYGKYFCFRGVALVEVLPAMRCGAVRRRLYRLVAAIGLAGFGRDLNL